MAIVGLGTDIVEIARIERIIARTLPSLEDVFAMRILNDCEREKLQETKCPARYLAKRFAVKEAAAKALGTGIACGVTFHDFTVSNDALGKPILSLSGQAKIRADALGVKHIFLTLSDEKHYAIATVLFEQ